MASARISSEALHRPAADLVDRMLACYIDWREMADSVAETYRHWSAAPAEDQPAGFLTYSAALDREQAAAGLYARAVTEVERWLHRPARSARD
jgi:hypothetical protein